MINILNFKASSLRLDEKTSLGLKIYYAGYVNKKLEWGVNSVNPLYLMINRFYVTISEKDSNKYLTFDNISKNDSVLKKYDQVFAGIKHPINKIDKSDGEYDKDYMKIKFLSDDDIPLDKMLYFQTVTIIIRCVFKQKGIYYPQVYLDNFLYQV